jgi:hypothetical protein
VAIREKHLRRLGVAGSPQRSCRSLRRAAPACRPRLAQADGLDDGAFFEGS